MGTAQHTMRPANRLLAKRRCLTPAPSVLCASCRAARHFASAAAPPPPPAPPRAGLVVLASRRLLAVSGPDAPRFLQGMITQNIFATAPPHQDPGSSSSSTAAAAAAAAAANVRRDAVYSAFLTATGRVLYDVFIYPGHRGPPATATAAAAAGESFLIEVDAAEAAHLARHIARHRLRARFAARLLAPDEATVWHGWDDDNDNDDNDSGGIVGGGDGVVAHARDPRAPGLGWRVVTAGVRAPPAVDLPRVAAAAEEEEGVYRVRRYLHGVAEGAAELARGAALPLEGNLDAMGAVDFRKGCYVGQELTVRTRHRGVVRKRVLPVVVYGGGGGGGPPRELVYDPRAARRGGGAAAAAAVVDAAAIPAGTRIGRLGRPGRSTGRWLRGVGNVGLALCRLEAMTDVVPPGETAAATYRPTDEFVVEQPPGEAGEDGVRVKIKAFVPEWLRRGLARRDRGQK